MRIDRKYTCPDIEEIQRELRKEIETLDLPKETVTKIMRKCSKHIERIRETNSELRDACNEALNKEVKEDSKQLTEAQIKELNDIWGKDELYKQEVSEKEFDYIGKCIHCGGNMIDDKAVNYCSECNKIGDGN